MIKRGLVDFGNRLNLQKGRKILINNSKWKARKVPAGIDWIGTWLGIPVISIINLWGPERVKVPTTSTDMITLGSAFVIRNQINQWAITHILAIPYKMYPDHPLEGTWGANQTINQTLPSQKTTGGLNHCHRLGLGQFTVPIASTLQDYVDLILLRQLQRATKISFILLK